LLGLPSPRHAGRFAIVQVDADLSLDFIDAGRAIAQQRCHASRSRTIGALAHGRDCWHALNSPLPNGPLIDRAGAPRWVASMNRSRQPDSTTRGSPSAACSDSGGALKEWRVPL
jgi:hypothetical protein